MTGALVDKVGEVDPFVERNRQLLLERSNRGIHKYGHTLERDDLTTADWLQHAIEEALDFANYLQVIKERIENEGNDIQ